MNNNLNFKVYTDGRSEDIQSHLFSLGCGWFGNGVSLCNLNYPFLYIQNGELSGGSDMVRFKEHHLPELTAAEVLNLKTNPLKPFTKVLARNRETGVWRADLYSHYGESIGYPFTCMGDSWEYCIPYESNERLLGTTNNFQPTEQ